MSKRSHEDAMQTRQRILEAANKVFIEQGFEKASLSEIAREAQVTRGAIYWHFENKNDIFIELLEAQSKNNNLRITIFAAADPDCPNPLGLLRKWMELFFNEATELIVSPALVNICVSIMASKDNNDARSRLVDFIKMRNRSLEAALRNAVARHQLPRDLDVKMAATYLKAICDGQFAFAYNKKSYFKREHYLKMVEVAFAHLGELRKVATSQAQIPQPHHASYQMHSSVSTSTRRFDLARRINA